MRRFTEFHVWIPGSRKVYRTQSSEDAAVIAKKYAHQGAMLFAISDGFSGMRRHQVHIASSIQDTRRLASKAKRLFEIDNIEGD